MVNQRQRLAQGAAAFLADGGSRPRAVLVRGPAGIGKSRFLDEVQVTTLASGQAHLIVADDVASRDDSWLDRTAEQLRSDGRTRLLVAGTDLPPSLVRLVDQLCERRLIEVPPLLEEEARTLLTEAGVQPWSLLASQIIATSDGVPRTILDRALMPVDLTALDRDDATFTATAWSAGWARRSEHVYRGEDAEHAAWTVELERLVDDADTGPGQRADALAVLARRSLQLGDLEEAVQRAEMATVLTGAEEAPRLLAAGVGAAARALRGEPTAMLSLHALAGRAARAGMPLVESEIWRIIGWSAGNLSDVTTAHRAFARAAELADTAGAVAHAVQVRLSIADLLVATQATPGARAYFDEAHAVADHLGLHKLSFDALVGLARACSAEGRFDDACRHADAAIELVVRTGACRQGAVEAAVVGARAYAAVGSTDFALATLQALVDLEDRSASVDFWLPLEGIRIAAQRPDGRARLDEWARALASHPPNGFGGALRAAHAEAEAWQAHAAGRRAEAVRLAERARSLWARAECHDEVALTDRIVQANPPDHGPRISLVGSTTEQAAPAPEPAEDPAAFEVLTKREREIARYVAGGLTNPEIAGELHLSPRTVEHHVASILRKLELPNRRALVRGRV